jgi:hypothetical protein
LRSLDKSLGTLCPLVSKRDIQNVGHVDAEQNEKRDKAGDPKTHRRAPLPEPGRAKPTGEKEKWQAHHGASLPLIGPSPATLPPTIASLVDSLRTVNRKLLESRALAKRGKMFSASQNAGGRLDEAASQI